MGYLEFATTVVKLLFVAGILGALVWFIVLPIVKAWREMPDEEALQIHLPELTEAELQVPTSLGTEKPSREAMIRQIKDDPLRAAAVMRQWLREKAQEKERRSR
jgi:flagellar biosynthesis/type III secretory pathway M-ring protein FliF/YscJ